MCSPGRAAVQDRQHGVPVPSHSIGVHFSGYPEAGWQLRQEHSPRRDHQGGHCSRHVCGQGERQGFVDLIVQLRWTVGD